LECTGKKSARKTDDYKSRHYEKGADEGHHHLTRIRPQKSAIKGRQNLYNPVVFEAVNRYNRGHVDASGSAGRFLWQAQKVA
jgi:hypothetical protein